MRPGWSRKDPRMNVGRGINESISAIAVNGRRNPSPRLGFEEQELSKRAAPETKEAGGPRGRPASGRSTSARGAFSSRTPAGAQTRSRQGRAAAASILRSATRRCAGCPDSSLAGWKWRCACGSRERELQNESVACLSKRAALVKSGRDRSRYPLDIAPSRRSRRQQPCACAPHPSYGAGFTQGERPVSTAARKVSSRWSAPRVSRPTTPWW
jgi:hypothetical protein